VALELATRLLIGYVSGFASNSTYGAFGVPIALLVWIYVIARLLMVVAAWTADRCDAPLVQPRFVEAAAAMRAAGDRREAEVEEVWERDHLPSAETAPPAQAPVARNGSVPPRRLAVGVVVGLVIGVLVGRRR
jgi:membrane protein